MGALFTIKRAPAAYTGHVSRREIIIIVVLRNSGAGSST
jgi:hypothetical protein